MVVLYKISMGRPAGSGRFNNASVKCSFTIFCYYSGALLSCPLMSLFFVSLRLN